MDHPPTASAPRRLLLVDDDRALLRSLARLFKPSRDIEVRSASTVDEAIILAAEWEPDACITDIDLGEQRTGFDVGLALSGLGIPFALASGHVDEERRARAVAVGAREIVPKPDDPREIVARLLDDDEWDVCGRCGQPASAHRDGVVDGAGLTCPTG